jgi:hypothetical protein
MTMKPIRRKRQVLTSSLSRRGAASHSLVASDPVTDRFGPRSTPISTAPTTSGGGCYAITTEPPISPTGKLFIGLEATPTVIPAPHVAPMMELASA